MSLFVDSAFVPDISRLCQAYPVAGVTTNPSILLAAWERGQRLDDIQLLRELLAACPGAIFMQPTADTREELYRVAHAYVDTDPLRVVLKLPATPTGFAVARELAPVGARFAFTAVASVAQAYLAAMAGAGWAIPYFCRLRHAGIDVSQTITDMSRMLSDQHCATHILAASLKTPSDVIEATLAGAHDVTAPPAVIEAMALHEMTEAAVRQFADDWQKLRCLS
jgi:TalC/MipB family fructose-6-phosphate aldolase